MSRGRSSARTSLQRHSGSRISGSTTARPIWTRRRQAATPVDPARKDFTALADAEAKFRAQGITAEKRVICYCGGAISATIDLFVLHQLGYDDLTLYDGSKGEWAKDPTLPIETD